MDVVITEAGKQVLASIDELSDEMDGIIKSLSGEEAIELNCLLDKLRENHSN